MTDNEMNSLKTDIALIQKDVKQIERVFQKVDHAVEQMAEIHKALAVQENILENNEKRISIVEDKLIKHNEDELMFRKELNNKLEDMRTNAQIERERRHKELLESIEKLNKSMSEKLDKQDKRISALENWRWYLLGIGAVLLFILNKIPWAALFG
jgi:anaerobic ribonucleoside-triphosphate reductase